MKTLFSQKQESFAHGLQIEIALPHDLVTWWWIVRSIEIAAHFGNKLYRGT
jgi:hypothetical protein